MSLIAFILGVLSVASGGVNGSPIVLTAFAVVATFIWAVTKYVFFPGGAADQWQTTDLTEQQARSLEKKSRSRRMRTVAIVLLAPVGMWALFHYVIVPDVVIKYKLMAEVTMQGKIYTGSAVIETRWTQTMFNPLRLADDWTEREKGEAVVVDMAENGVVLITLAGYPQQQPEQLPQMVSARRRERRRFVAFFGPTPVTAWSSRSSRIACRW